MKHAWLVFHRGDVETERLQCEQEGKEIGELAGEFDRLSAADLADPREQAAFGELMDRAAELPVRARFPYVEPSDLQGILAERRAAVMATAPSRLAAAELEDRVYGAWLGRCAGCLLGKPVEGWRRPAMWGLLKESGRWPLSDYFRWSATPAEVRERHGMREHAAWGDRVDSMPEDDDTNYTTVGLALMRRYGPAFTPEDVADFWLGNLPILHTCTAERVAYRNLVNEVPPPASATVRNPYREWIGAQIRADFFGYAAPGDPAKAAALAWRDACISHVKNGIYGEMWAAAMVAAAFTATSPRACIEAGLGEIPARSRLAEALRETLGWFDSGVAYDEAVERLHRAWDETRGHDWCHTISNAVVVAIALLWGEGDFGATVCRAVQPCFDTDCNGATAGSVMGALLGRATLPTAWTGVLNDTLHTGVAGYHTVRLADMTRHTLAVIERVAALG